MGPFELHGPRRHRRRLRGLEVVLRASPSASRAGARRCWPRAMVAAGASAARPGAAGTTTPATSRTGPEDPPAPEAGGGDGRLVVIAGDLAAGRGAGATRRARRAGGWPTPRTPSGEVPCADRRLRRAPRSEAPLQGGPQLVLCAEAPLAALDPRGQRGRLPRAAAARRALVELTRSPTTSTLPRARRARSSPRSGQHVEWVGDAPGLVLGRIVCQLVNEAGFALGEGVGAAEDIDAGMVARPQPPARPARVGRRDRPRPRPRRARRAVRGVPRGALPRRARCCARCGPACRSAATRTDAAPRGGARRRRALDSCVRPTSRPKVDRGAPPPPPRRSSARRRARPRRRVRRAAAPDRDAPRRGRRGLRARGRPSWIVGASRPCGRRAGLRARRAPGRQGAYVVARGPRARARRRAARPRAARSTPSPAGSPARCRARRRPARRPPAWRDAIVDPPDTAAGLAASPLLALVDSQLDTAHPEFAGGNVSTLGGLPVASAHGTETAAVAAARRTTTASSACGRASHAQRAAAREDPLRRLVSRHRARDRAGAAVINMSYGSRRDLLRRVRPAAARDREGDHAGGRGGQRARQRQPARCSRPPAARPDRRGRRPGPQTGVLLERLGRRRPRGARRRNPHRDPAAVRRGRHRDGYRPSTARASRRRWWPPPRRGCGPRSRT